MSPPSNSGQRPSHRPSQFFSPCPRGLEDFLVKELQQFGAKKTTAVPGGVRYRGDMALCYRTNLASRIASRVLWQVSNGHFQNEEDIYNLTKKIPWHRFFLSSRTIRVDVTCRKSGIKSPEFLALKIKDAICDRFREQTGKRPNVSTSAPSIRIFAYIEKNQILIYLDTSGVPLYQRNLKIAKVQAPLKENLAAGLLKLAHWKPGIPLLDPMCGSGTFLLESAQIALNVAPGLSKKVTDFAVSRLFDFDETLWQKTRQSLILARRSNYPLKIYGSDLSQDAVARSHQNLALGRLDKLVDISCEDLLSRQSPPHENGILIANPPYGERIGEKESLLSFYPRLGDALKKNFPGWTCYFLSSDRELPKHIGLFCSKKIPVFNGALDCRLYEFKIVSGPLEKGITETEAKN